MSDVFSPNSTPTGIRVKRLNRRPLFIVLTLGLLVLLAFIYMINQSSKRQQARLNEEAQHQLPTDSILARNILEGKPEYGAIGAENQPPPFSQHNAPAPSPLVASEPTAVDKELLRIQKLKQAKLEEAITAKSKVAGAMGSGGLQLPAASATAVSHVAGLEAGLNGLQNGLLGEEDPNKQQHKQDFYLEKQPITEYLLHTRNQPQSPLEVKTGTVIPATMLGGLNSDLPGMILAQVSQNVYDTATGKYLLIPQGSRLVGSYDNFIAYGQSRALVAWNRIIYPDGSTLELEGMPGTDQGGYAGLKDQVDNHYLRIFSSAVLMSVITGIYDFSQDVSTRYYGEPRSAGDTMASAVARELTQTSQMLLRKNLNIQATIKIRPGYKLNVMVNRDILFPSIW